MAATTDAMNLKNPRKHAAAVAPIPRLAAGGSFPIVGIGASAGGLEALEQFFKNVPPASGLAFVIVQHLDPTHVGIMPELLQRMTPLAVVQVKDRTTVKPNCVYVIPPNKDMSVLRGVLHLLEPASPRGLRLPIDFFFRSLAADQGERSVGVILSGMGSDGTLGLRAIKEHAGLGLVQEPASAKFDGMPSSATNAGLADIVAPAEALPVKLLAFLKYAPLFAPLALPAGDAEGSGLEKVIILLRNQTGHDFSLYKSNTLYRRIERRMGLHQIAKIGNYVRYLRENPQELGLLFRELLIGVTSFFRDPEVWDQLRDEILPLMLAGRPTGRALRAWVPGCSTGEEAYSLAMIFLEALERKSLQRKFSLQIFATDLDADAVQRARQGFYPITIAADVTPDRLRRFFHEEARGYRVVNEIREMVIFAPQNLIMDPPFTKLDVLTCRNLLIYFTPELQKKLLPLFHYSLNPGGVLLLGSAESGSGFTRLFTPFRGKSRLFRRTESDSRPDLMAFPSSFNVASSDATKTVRAPLPSPAGLQAEAERWLLQNHAPAAVLVNDEGDILFISGHTGRYLEPAAGKANWNVFVMARESLRHELTAAFQQARRQPGPITAHRLPTGDESAAHFVDVTVKFFAEATALQGLAMITFHALPPLAAVVVGRGRKPRRGRAQVGEWEQKVQQARAEVQRMGEEMQTSQEELKSMNEELQSTNEELQSTNEELTTSKEEMQSLNEELQTVNTELQSKVDELNAASNDMKNLLNSTEIATVFLDNTLKVRRFTEKATKVFKLISTDVGRPITDLASQLQYPELTTDAQEVLRSLVTMEKSLATHDGRWFAMRLMPYRTMDDRINGVVMTFTDVTVAKKLEAELRARPGGSPPK